MSKNTGTSELINYFDLGANGDVGIAGSLDVNTIANATTDTDTFLVSDTGIIKYRTGTQLLSDIGAQGLLTNPVTGTGAAGQVTYWSSGSAITGSSNFLFDASQRNLNIDRSLSTLGNAITISKGSDVDQAWLAFKQGGGASGTWRLGYSGDPYDFRISAGSDSSIGTQALRIFVGTQNVAIGTSTSDNGAKLQVVGLDNSNIFTLLSGLNSRLHVGTVTSPNNDVYIRSQNNYNLKLGTNNTNYLSIFNSGNVFIGTSESDNGARLQVNGNSIINGILVVGNSIDSGGAVVGDISVSPNSSKIGYIPTSVSNRGYFEPYDGSGFVNIVSTFSTGGITFKTTNSVTERMRIESNGNVGIGTTTPTSSFNGRLSVRNEDAANNPTLVLFKNITSDSSEDIFRVQSWNGALNTVASIKANGSATFGSTNGIVTVNRSSTSFASLFKMSTAGVDNWSIGVPTLSSADWVLFNHATGISNLSFASATGAATFSGGATFSGNIVLTNGANRLLRIGSSTSYYYDLQTTGDDFQIIEAGGTPRLTIKYPNGNVGIGTASPDANSKLDVNGQAFVGRLAIYNNNGTPSLGTSPILYSPASGTLAISTNVSERLRINSSGNVLINTTTDNGSKLYVNGASYLDGYNYASSIQYTRPVSNTVNPAGGEGVLIFSGGQAAMRMNSNYTMNFDMYNSGTQHTALQIRQNGNTVSINSPNNSLALELKYQDVASGYLGAISSALYAYSTNGGYVLLNASSVWVPASDAKRKRNFEPYTNGLSSILGLQPKLYNMDFQKDGDEKQVGLVAQEVREFIPLAYEENNGFIGLNYNAIIVTMVKAIQELKQQLDTLTNENN